ncbi:hypothetical protein F5884DRAFT_1671 [Xylogone sp. PMI_703]|nr:hypothetical protein F5884DRAFT_1671 [Xylogone sp. PMI_703]
MPTILILGAGPRIGLAVAERFKDGGYTVVLAKRNSIDEEAKAKGYETVSVDAGNLNSIKEVFKTVTTQYGIPSVVVYNAMSITYPKDFNDPYLSVTPESFAQDLSVLAVGTFAAIQETLTGWKQLGGGPKAFIATGSLLPQNPLPLGFTLGAGKSAMEHLIDCGAQMYGKQGYRFYYASQGTNEGRALPSNDLVSAETHANVYWDLANQQGQGDWDVRFTGTGELISK